MVQHVGQRQTACQPASAIHPPTTNTLRGTYRNNRCVCSLFALIPDIDQQEAILTAASLSLHKQHTDRLVSTSLEATESFNRLQCTLESGQSIKKGEGWLGESDQSDFSLTPDCSDLCLKSPFVFPDWLDLRMTHKSLPRRGAARGDE